MEENGNGRDDGPLDAHGDLFERENGRVPARSLMSLSRADHRWTKVEAGDVNSRLYSSDDHNSAPHRAFWHPGVGMWQIDKLDGGKFNHAERASTEIGGKFVASKLLDEYCGTPQNLKAGVDQKALRGYLARKWNACLGDSGKENCWITLGNMYLAERDDLFVVASYNISDRSTSGGVIRMKCLWFGKMISGQFDCHLFDTERPEGYVVDETPNGQIIGQGSSRNISPYASPFISTTYGGNRFAAFPGSLLPDSLLTPIKAVPIGALVRSYSGSTWHSGTFNGNELRVVRCHVAMVRGRPNCVSKNVADVAGDIGGSFADWISPQRSSGD
ncbi:hypothetical protein [Candidatus Poriferisodalis sp.]|uniref:hypothetical protein n=1 Tax=Candidatus Poriferisodalis sp. TaxID=3101277 RepID=UPI003B01D296